MRLRLIGIPAFALVLAAMPRRDARGQQAATQPRERVHPELVDDTWGRRVKAAWDLAFARQWDTARTSFDALHREQPVATEPLLGLGFIARGSGHRADAEQWFRAVLAIDPSSSDARSQLAAVEWDRPTTFDASIGTARVNGASVSDWSAGFSIRPDAKFSVNGQLGQITAGDPFTGIFLDSASGGGVRASFVTGGLVWRPTDKLTIAGRSTRWTAPGVHHDFVWIDGVLRVNSKLTARVGARPVSGAGAPQLSGGVDLVAPRQVATVELVQGTRAAPFEARTAVRLFYVVTPSVRSLFRLALVREMYVGNSATTLGGSATWYARPALGARFGVSTRRGAFARSSADVGIIVRP